MKTIVSERKKLLQNPLVSRYQTSSILPCQDPVRKPVNIKASFSFCFYQIFTWKNLLNELIEFKLMVASLVINAFTNHYFNRTANWTFWKIILQQKNYINIRSLYRTYGFVGVDATLVPGPKRPFNFFGALDNEQVIYFN